jgi:hypothetical protein
MGRIFGLPTEINIAIGMAGGAFLAFWDVFVGVFEFIMVFPL